MAEIADFRGGLSQNGGCCVIFGCFWGLKSGDSIKNGNLTTKKRITVGKQHKKCVFVGCAISHPGIARSWPCDFYCFVSVVDGFGGTFIGWCFSLTIGLNLSSVHHSHHVPWRWKGWIIGWKMMDAISCVFFFLCKNCFHSFLGDVFFGDGFCGCLIFHLAFRVI